MVRMLLVRGMLAGIVAGLLSFGFLKVYGEPQVERAIAFETQTDETKAADENIHSHTHATAHEEDRDVARAVSHDHATSHEMAHEKAGAREEQTELVSRPVQAGLGLFVAVMVYCTAFGGLFGLAFAFAWGRLPGAFTPQAVAVILAAAGFVAICLVPGLKYPANPPAAGDADTIGVRTALYFVMIAISLAAMIASLTLKRWLTPQFGEWSAILLVAACYIVLVTLAAFALPSIDEVPAAFPAAVLWKFRIASVGAQFIMWATFGLLFGGMTARALRDGRLAA